MAYMPAGDVSGSRRLVADVRAGAAAIAFALVWLFAAIPTLAAGPDDGLPAFTLLDQNGREFTGRDLAGRPTVMHFGFTHCPVVCPTTLYEIAERLADLGTLADQINFVFVSVDPDRDTPVVLKEYIASFDTRIVGLTGSSAQIRRLADAVGARFERHPAKDGGYDMDHSIEGFLLDRNGRRVSALHVGYGADSAKTLAALKSLIGSVK